MASSFSNPIISRNCFNNIILNARLIGFITIIKLKCTFTVKAEKPLETIGAIHMPSNPTTFTTEAEKYFSCRHSTFLKEPDKKCATNGCYISLNRGRSESDRHGSLGHDEIVQNSC